MNIVDTLNHLNNLRAAMLGSKVKEAGSANIVVYAAELEALDEAIELLKGVED